MGLGQAPIEGGRGRSYEEENMYGDTCCIFGERDTENSMGSPQNSTQEEHCEKQNFFLQEHVVKSMFFMN